MKKRDILYLVKVTQEIPCWSGDELDFCESSGEIDEYVAGSFQSEEYARMFAEALRQKIAEGCEYAFNAFTPTVSVVKVTKTFEEV